MRRAKRVVDIDIGKRGELAAEFGVVLLLALIETQILEDDDLPLLKRFDLRTSILSDGVGGEDDVRIDEL